MAGALESGAAGLERHCIVLAGVQGTTRRAQLELALAAAVPQSAWSCHWLPSDDADDGTSRLALCELCATLNAKRVCASLDDGALSAGGHLLRVRLATGSDVAALLAMGLSSERGGADVDQEAFRIQLTESVAQINESMVQMVTSARCEVDSARSGFDTTSELAATLARLTSRFATPPVPPPAGTPISSAAADGESVGD